MLAIYRRSLFVFWAVSQIFAFYLLWQTGSAARLRDLLRRRIRSAFWLRFAYGFALATIAGLAAFPASAAQYRVSVVFDQSNEPFLRWLREGVLHLAIDALVVGLIVAMVMTLVAKMRSWWVFAILGVFMVSLIGGLITPFVIAPLFNHYWPMSQREAAPFVALERVAGMTTPIWRFNSSRQSQIPNVSTIGVGPSARIVLGDTMFAAGTRGEIRYAMAREIAHVRRDDPLRTAFVWTFFFVLAVAIGVLVADRIGFRRDDDPLARLALVCALTGVAGMLLFPLYNVYSRHIEEKADAYALSLTHDPASAVRSYVRSADRRFVQLCPSRLATIYFWPTPPIGTRIAAATGRPDPCQ